MAVLIIFPVVLQTVHFCGKIGYL